MDREFEYFKDELCENCGKLGAFDIYGDFICEKCLGELVEVEVEEE